MLGGLAGRKIALTRDNTTTENNKKQHDNFAKRLRDSKLKIMPSVEPIALHQGHLFSLRKGERNVKAKGASISGGSANPPTPLPSNNGVSAKPVTPLGRNRPRTRSVTRAQQGRP